MQDDIIHVNRLLRIKQISILRELVSVNRKLLITKKNITINQIINYVDIFNNLVEDFKEIDELFHQYREYGLYHEFVMIDKIINRRMKRISKVSSIIYNRLEYHKNNMRLEIPILKFDHKGRII